jgi:hypothetical protein
MPTAHGADSPVPEAGAIVGARRWPHEHAHPDCWGRPWCGTVLALDDPRAWAGTLRFPDRVPTPSEAARHVAWCRSQGLLDGCVPVLWDFGGVHRVHWESVGGERGVRAYAEDLAFWERARAAARR